ncbi:hypothetical protein C8R43DRAFT_955218 [Mycena crocata]|nr:hypothetical protein C8R43DRAFT_955218 [Mycena crocata]
MDPFMTCKSHFQLHFSRCTELNVVDENNVKPIFLAALAPGNSMCNPLKLSLRSTSSGPVTRVFRFMEVAIVNADVGQSEAQAGFTEWMAGSEKLLPRIVLPEQPHRSARSAPKQCPNYSQGVPGITSPECFKHSGGRVKMAKFHSLGVPRLHTVMGLRTRLRRMHQES